MPETTTASAVSTGAKRSGSNNGALTTGANKPWFDYNRSWEAYFENPRTWAEWTVAWDGFLFDSVRNMGDSEIRRLKDSIARYRSGALIVAPTVYSSLWLASDAMRETYLLVDELLVTVAASLAVTEDSYIEDSEKNNASPPIRLWSWRAVLLSPMYALNALLRPFVHPYRQLVRHVAKTPRTSNDIRGHLALASTTCLLLLEAPLRLLVLRKYLHQSDEVMTFRGALTKECLPATACLIGLWLNFRGGMVAREKGRTADETVLRRSMTQVAGRPSGSTSAVVAPSKACDVEDEEGDAPMWKPRGQMWKPCLFRLHLAAYSLDGFFFFFVGASAKINAIYFVLAPDAEQPGGVVPLLYKSTIAGLQAVPFVETAGNLGLSWFMGLPPLPIKFSNVSSQLLKTLKDTEIIPEYALTLAQAAPLISAALGMLAFVYI